MKTARLKSHLVSAIAILLAASTSISFADEVCQSKVFVYRDCVPSDIVLKALEVSTASSFLGFVQTVYSEGGSALQKKNSPLADSDEAPGQMLFSSNMALTKGLFGRDFETVRQGQYGLLQAFCTKHGGTLKSSKLQPRLPKGPGIPDAELSLCLDHTGNAVAGISIFQGKDARFDSDHVFAYYLSSAISRAVVDFRASIKPGDKTQIGMVVDTRGGIAKIQLAREEKWIEVDRLLPSELRNLAH